MVDEEIKCDVPAFAIEAEGRAILNNALSLHEGGWSSFVFYIHSIGRCGSRL